MSHLSAERLAALDAGATTPEEGAHLASCAACASEREAYRRVAALAADERTRLAPPLTDWSTLSAALRDDGVLVERDGEKVAPTVRRASTPTARRVAGQRWGMRAAAAALLALGGMAAGRASAGVPPVPGFAVATPVSGSGASGVPVPARAIGRTVSVTTATFRSTTDALVALARAEAQYQLAAAFLLEHDSTGRGAAAARASLDEDSSSVYRARLVALDNVMAASREALYEAPHDPVINRYYLATVGAREATLRQLNTALPAGARLTRY